MKKMIMAVAVVACAFCASAAAVDWKTSTTGKIYGAGSTTLLTTGTAYLFNIATYSQTDVLNAFVAGTDLATMALTEKKTVTNGAIATGTFETTLTGNTTLYVAVLADDSIYISGTTLQNIPDVGSTQFQFNAKATSQAAAIGAASEGYSTAGWYTAVPEPTSGLLLLLGMAGLALKRKVA